MKKLHCADHRGDRGLAGMAAKKKAKKPAAAPAMARRANSNETARGSSGCLPIFCRAGLSASTWRPAEVAHRRGEAWRDRGWPLHGCSAGAAPARHFCRVELAARRQRRRRDLGCGRLLGRREQLQQRALDRHLARRRGDLRAEQVGHVEHVDHALAERRDMRRGDVEAELRQRRGQLVEQARPVEAGHLDHRVAVGPLVVDGDLGLEREGLEPALGGRAPRHHLRQLERRRSAPSRWCRRCARRAASRRRPARTRATPRWCRARGRRWW